MVGEGLDRTVLTGAWSTLDRGAKHLVLHPAHGWGQSEGPGSTLGSHGEPLSRPPIASGWSQRFDWDQEVPTPALQFLKEAGATCNVGREGGMHLCYWE